MEHRVINSRLEIASRSDYFETPRASGYRGVHIVVRYQGRSIELQLKTPPMHSWALAAEKYSEAIGENLKQDGEHPIQLFLAAAGELDV